MSSFSSSPPSAGAAAAASPPTPAGGHPTPVTGQLREQIRQAGRLEQVAAPAVPEDNIRDIVPESVSSQLAAITNDDLPDGFTLIPLPPQLKCLLDHVGLRALKNNVLYFFCRSGKCSLVPLKLQRPLNIQGVSADSELFFPSSSFLFFF